MSSPRQTDMPLDPALARWLEPLRESTPRPVTSEEITGPQFSEPTSPRAGSDEEHQLRRAEHIQKLRSLIRNASVAQAKARRRSLWSWGSAAAAALTLAAGGTLFVQSEQSELVTTTAAPVDQANLRQLWGQVVARRHGGATEVLGAGSVVGAGDELSTTAEAYASLDVGRIRVDLSSATTVELMRTGMRDQAYRLRAGRVDVSVPHVPTEKQSLEVVTPNAVVHVKGTVFSVEVDSQSGTPVTRVQVTRGAVGVAHQGVQQTINAGQSWSSAGASVGALTELEPPAEPDEDGSDETSARNGGSTTRPNDRGFQKDNVEAAPRVTPAERSSLRDQNQLFARALQAQRRGNSRLATQLFTMLLKKYPDSPLGPSAQKELETVRAATKNP